MAAMPPRANGSCGVGFRSIKPTTRGVARNSFWAGTIFYCTILQSYILAAWRRRLQLVHKIIFRDWFWEGIYTDIPPSLRPCLLRLHTHYGCNNPYTVPMVYCSFPILRIWNDLFWVETYLLTHLVPLRIVGRVFQSTQYVSGLLNFVYILDWVNTDLVTSPRSTSPTLCTSYSTPSVYLFGFRSGLFANVRMCSALHHCEKL